MNGLKLAQLLGQPCNFYASRQGDHPLLLEVRQAEALARPPAHDVEAELAWAWTA
jgi:hypothetical protein